MTGEISVRPADARDAAGWNDFLDSLPRSSPLNRFEWRAVVEEGYRVETRFYVAFRAGGIVGVLPTYITRSPRGRRRLYSLRWGLSAVDADVGDALLDIIEEVRRNENLASALVTSGGVRLSGRRDPQIKKTVALEVADDEEDAWETLNPKARNKIRKARKSGIEIDDSEGNVDEVYRLYLANMLRLGVPVHCHGHFRALSRHFSDRADWLVARLDGRAVAGMLLLYGKEVATHNFQSSEYSSRTLGVAQLLNWEAMRRCRAGGIRTLDMGESRENSPVYQSKVNFGAAPQDLYYYDLERQHAPSSPAGGGGASRAASLALDRWLMRRSPLWMRRSFALWKLRHGRIL